MDELITSFANPTVKRVRALAARKQRRREGAFVVEGLQPVWRAVTSGWPVDTLIVAPGLLVNPDALDMVSNQQRAGTRVVRVSPEVFRHLSDRDGPAGLAAIVGGTVAGLEGFHPRPQGPVVALHRAGNPGNIGAILRSADAAGAAGMLLVGETADPFAPSAVKSSMGSIFAVPVARAADPEDLFGWARQRDRPVVAVTGRGATGIWDATLPPTGVLLLGSEGDGLPDDLADRCDGSVSIPMRGTAESLNLATAAAVVLYEMSRRAWQRGPAAAEAADRTGPSGPEATA